MNELPALTAALAAGFFLGAMFFGGLWWTVRRGMSSPLPALWFLGSMLFRAGFALAGFYYVYAVAGQWTVLLACLLGFVMARMLITRFLPAPLPAAAR